MGFVSFDAASPQRVFASSEAIQLLSDSVFKQALFIWAYIY